MHFVPSTQSAQFHFPTTRTNRDAVFAVSPVATSRATTSCDLPYEVSGVDIFRATLRVDLQRVLEVSR